MEHDKTKLYAWSTCSNCKADKRFLDECNVSYEFANVDKLTGEDRKAIIADVKELNPRCSFPTIKIGDTVIVGFKEDKIREALGIKDGD